MGQPLTSQHFGPMLEVGGNDAFERIYVGKFRELAAKHGEFVTYERDRAARDIGVHITEPLASGKQRVSSALCWFQLKGKKASTLSADEIQKLDAVSIRLETKHLKFWFLQPMPTYLAVYLEALDYFVIVDIQKLITREFGREILTRSEKTTSVDVPLGSRLDAQAFFQILVQSDISDWQKAIGADEETAYQIRRNYHLLWRLGTAKRRCGRPLAIIFVLPSCQVAASTPACLGFQWARFRFRRRVSAQRDGRPCGHC